MISGHGAPPLAFGVHPDGTQRFNPLEVVSGTWPRGANEIAIDANTASKDGYKVGDTIGAIARGPVQRYTITGIVKIGGVSSLGGATMAIFDFSDRAGALPQAGQARLDLDRGEAGRDSRRSS